MSRKVFYSFHYDVDVHRVSQVRNMGVLEGQPLLTSNRWEEVKRGGDAGIKSWIDGEMAGKSCLVVLVGAATAGRKWVDYEIDKAWADGKGVVGVYIHNLKNLSGNQATKGSNPFAGHKVGLFRQSMTGVVTDWESPYTTSTYVYDDIKKHLPDLVEKAIDIRKNFVG